jgi:hypothetical protein
MIYILSHLYVYSYSRKDVNYNHRVCRVKIGQKKVVRKSTVEKVGLPHFYMP